MKRITMVYQSRYKFLFSFLCIKVSYFSFLCYTYRAKEGQYLFTLICQHLYGEQIGEYAVSQSIKEWNQNAFLWGVQGYEFLTFHRFLVWQSGIMLKSYT